MIFKLPSPGCIRLNTVKEAVLHPRPQQQQQASTSTAVVSPLIFLANSPAQPQPSPSPGLQPTHHYSPTQGHKIHKFVNLFNAPAGCSRGPGPELGPSRTIYSELIFFYEINLVNFPLFPIKMCV